MTGPGIEITVEDHTISGRTRVTVFVDPYYQKPLPHAVRELITSEQSLGIIEDGVLMALGFENHHNRSGEG